MLKNVKLTPDLLLALGEQAGGCDFSDPAQVEFLLNNGACDIQAAPGHGKTTLLAAKLSLIARSWGSTRSGVCVISHTNAARVEVERQVARKPEAAALLGYPHFVGTVTAFVHQYLALPYLRGLGWHVSSIDDDAFAAEALRRYPFYWALKNQARRAEATVKEWVAKLTLDSEFEVHDGPLERLSVKKQKRQHNAHTPCGIALEQLKASMVNGGLFRYADMTALARRALKDAPSLAAAIRARFPMAILDEAQDTHGEQLELLELLFKHKSTAFQRLGDCNQTIYEGDSGTSVYWNPGRGSTPLNTSRRFGVEIAGFASRLTVRQPQTIVGVASRPGVLVMILFDRATIGGVLKAFAEQALSLWGDECNRKEVWAVASRHRQASHRGEWRPKSLVDYSPSYRSDLEERANANGLHMLFRRAAVLHREAGSPAEIGSIFATGVARLVGLLQFATLGARRVTPQIVWSVLAQQDQSIPRRIRRLLRDSVLYGRAVWERAVWIELLRGIFALLGSLPKERAELKEFCRFLGEDELASGRSDPESFRQFHDGALSLRLGSIHSLKGRSVDGILVVESELWKGSRAADQCVDLSTVLPHAFGVDGRELSGVEVTAATNVFVGVTRTRELLGLALRKSEAGQLLGRARSEGWVIVDLVDKHAEEPHGE